MKKLLLSLILAGTSFFSQATIHVVEVWDGYFQFVDRDITITIGDTVHWLPLGGGAPSMTHTITSTNIPVGATPFDQIWQAPADTFFQYIPQVIGLYEYECTPHASKYNMIGSINVVDGTSGLNNAYSLINTLVLFPNPSSKNIHVEGLESITEYKIYSLNGKLLMLGKTEEIIDLSSLPEGNYMIEIIGDIPRTMKFQKL